MAPQQHARFVQFQLFDKILDYELVQVDIAVKLNETEPWAGDRT